LLFSLMGANEDQMIVSDVVSAHLRSINADHLTDIDASDERTVKPWFSGRLRLAPPVPDLTAKGFKLIGARLDYVRGQAVAALVYRRDDHVFNLFVAPAAGADHAPDLHAM